MWNHWVPWFHPWPQWVHGFAGHIRELTDALCGRSDVIRVFTDVRGDIYSGTVAAQGSKSVPERAFTNEKYIHIFRRSMIIVTKTCVYGFFVAPSDWLILCNQQNRVLSTADWVKKNNIKHIGEKNAGVLFTEKEADLSLSLRWLTVLFAPSFCLCPSLLTALSFSPSWFIHGMACWIKQPTRYKQNIEWIHVMWFFKCIFFKDYSLTLGQSLMALVPLK